MAYVTIAALKNGVYTVAVSGIARSTDAGATWSQVYTYATSNMMSICDTPSGQYAISYDGHLHQSTNIGLTWSDLGKIDATANSCNSIGYIGNNTLVVANSAAANSAFISYNMGSTWSVLLTTPYRMYHVLDMGGGTAAIFGSNGTSTGYEYKTTNYGGSWASVAGIGNFVAYDAVHLGSGVVVGTGTDTGTPQRQIYRSTDYGASWGMVYNHGSYYQGISIGWIPGTNYVFATLQGLYVSSDYDRPLIRSTDSGATWSSLGIVGAVSLYGGTSNALYSGRTTILCPGITPQAAIRVSYDNAGTWPVNATPYDPMLFLEISSAVAPVADFEGSPTGGYAPLGVTFTDLSTNTPASWLWDFGDGMTGSDQNPYHLYTGVGSYTVSLDATNGAGSDNETKTDYIVVSMAPPTADFEGFPVTGYEPLGVTFTDLSSGSPTGWYWDFGDGSVTGIEQNPYHMYTGSGTYSVVMTAFNEGGEDTESKANYIDVYGDVPVADFDMNKTSGYAPLSVRFTDTSTSVSAIVSWLWTFGDGNTSTDQNPSHVYTHPGIYTITLSVTNGAGRSDTETKSRVLAVTVATPDLMTIDLAPPQGDELLSHMVDTGDASINLYYKGARYYIPTSVSSPDNSGFRRPAGPSLIFD
jgi:PKD repeat protein